MKHKIVAKGREGKLIRIECSCGWKVVASVSRAHIKAEEHLAPKPKKPRKD